MVDNSKPDYLNQLEDLIGNYSKLYLKQLTYYGSDNHEYVSELIPLGQSVLKLEKIIIEEYYNPMINNNINNNNNCDFNCENYYLEKIILGFFEIIIKMCSMMMNNYMNISQIQIIIKNKFIIGFIENFIKKIINPIIINENSILQPIQSIHPILPNNTDLSNLNDFITKNKNNFKQNEIILFDKFIQLIK